MTTFNNGIYGRWKQKNYTFEYVSVATDNVIINKFDKSILTNVITVVIGLCLREF